MLAVDVHLALRAHAQEARTWKPQSNRWYVTGASATKVLEGPLGCVLKKGVPQAKPAQPQGNQRMRGTRCVRAARPGSPFEKLRCPKPLQLPPGASPHTVAMVLRSVNGHGMPRGITDGSSIGRPKISQELDPAGAAEPAIWIIAAVRAQENEEGEEQVSACRCQLAYA
jgi:hypothetical protein